MKTLNKLKHLILLLLLFLLTSCYSYTEIHEISFGISLGFDFLEETNEFSVYSYIINNTNLTPEGSASSEYNAYIGHAQGKTISAAIEEINKNLDIILEFKHVKTIFLTEKFINQENLNYLYKFLKNGPLFYPNFELYITKEKLEDIYKVQVFEETTLFYTLLTGQKKVHNYKVANFYDFINDYLIPDYFVSYPLIVVNKEVFENQKEPHSTIENDGLTFIVEGIPITLYYKEYPGLYLLNDFTDLLITLNDLELVINNYIFDYSLNTKNPNQIIDIIIKTDVAYVHSKNIENSELEQYTKKYLMEEIQKVFDSCCIMGIDILNINYLRSLKGLNKAQISDYKINFVIDVFHP